MSNLRAALAARGWIGARGDNPLPQPVGETPKLNLAPDGGAAPAAPAAGSDAAPAPEASGGDAAPLELTVPAEAAAALRAEGAAAERARIGAILGSEHAEGRAALAAHFAFATEMEPEAACAALAASPQAVPAAGPDGGPLATLMARAKLPEPPDAGGDAGGETKISPAQKILNARAKARGIAAKEV